MKINVTISFDTMEELQQWVNRNPDAVESIDAAPAPEMLMEVDATPPSLIPQDTSLSNQPNRITPSIFTAEEPTDTAPDVDSSGLPWDSRIHTSTKGTKKDGTFKRKPGVDKDEADRIEAELRAGGINHTQLLDRIIAQVGDGTINVFQLQPLLQELGLNSLQDASGDVELIKTIATRLGVE